MRNIQISKFSALFLLILALSAPGVFANATDPTAIVDVKPLAPTSRQTSLDQTISGLLSQHHYRQSKLDDRLSSK